MNPNVQHHKAFMKINPQMLEEARNICFRESPKWLGGFDFKIYGIYKNRNYGKLPPALKAAANLMNELTDTKYTTAFIQKYTIGQEVLSHKDPSDNIVDTLILPFGKFTGAITDIDGTILESKAGDVVLLPCTQKVAGKLVRGPTHSVSPVLTGTRYCLILNRIN